MEPIISIKKTNFTYNKGKDNEFQALININLEIYPEEFIIVFGPSGCGKSTLLNVIAGLEKPDNGELSVFSKDLMKMSKKDFAMFHRNEVGMVYQSYNLITTLSVLDNVALPQIFINVGKRKREKLALSLLDRFGIMKQARKIPTELSGGQQQRIGIARAIINDPKIVLADEPVGNLDSVSAENVLDILSDLNDREKKTVILVTHNPEYLYVGDRVIYMKDGIITREVVNQSRHERKTEKKQYTLSKLPAQELQDLMRTYQGLSPEQINILIMPYKAKIFAHHFITSRSMEETKIFEEIIQRNLLGTISNEEFFDVLHRNAMEGGVGFDKRTAEKIARRVRRILRIAYFIYQKEHQRKDEAGRHPKVTDDEKAKRVTEYLLNTCYFDFIEHLDNVQINRIQNAVKNRLISVIQKHEFYDILDKPFKEGGAGLNAKTAKNMTEELELILILGFGIVQMKKQPLAIREKRERDKMREKERANEERLKSQEKKKEYGKINFVPEEEPASVRQPADSGVAKEKTEAEEKAEEIKRKALLELKKKDEVQKAIPPHTKEKKLSEEPASTPRTSSGSGAVKKEKIMSEKTKKTKKDKAGEILKEEIAASRKKGIPYVERKEEEKFTWKERGNLLEPKNFMEMLKVRKRGMEKLSAINEVDSAIVRVELDIDNANKGRWNEIVTDNFGYDGLKEDLEISEKSKVVNILIDTLNVLKYKRGQLIKKEGNAVSEEKEERPSGILEKRRGIAKEDFFNKLKLRKKNMDRLKLINEIDAAITRLEFDIKQAQDDEWDEMIKNNFGYDYLKDEISTSEKSEIIRILFDTLNSLNKLKEEWDIYPE